MGSLLAGRGGEGGGGEGRVSVTGPGQEYSENFLTRLDPYREILKRSESTQPSGKIKDILTDPWVESRPVKKPSMHRVLEFRKKSVITNQAFEKKTY